MRVPVGKAHQRKIREQAELTEAGLNLFGKWWEQHDFSPQKATVKEVARGDVESIISRYEWLGNVPDNCNRFAALYFDDGEVMGGALAFSHQTFGGKYTLFKKPAVILSRGVTLHYSPRWASSFLISRAIRLLYGDGPPIYISAFTDWRAGEIGTVYQACNWVYLGEQKSQEWIAPDGTRRDASFHKVRLVSGSKHTRTGKVASRSQYKTEAARMLDAGWIYEKGITRGKYATVGGRKGKEYRAMKKHLQSQSKPYPKRHAKSSENGR